MSGFVYIWFDRKHKRFYVGSHWGTEDDGYVCSSTWMRQAYSHRPQDFKRRILARSADRKQMLNEEHRWLQMIKPSEMSPNKPARYYNLARRANHWHGTDKKQAVADKIQATRALKMAEISANISTAKIAAFERKRAATGSAFTAEHRKKIGDAQRGTTQSEESNQRRSEKSKAQRAAEPKVTCHCGKTGSGPPMRRWHFENCRAVPSASSI